MSRKYPLVPALVLSYFFSIGSFASAPVGIPPKNAEDAFLKSEVVFMGKVQNVTKDKQGFSSIANVEVEKVWKGKEFLGPSVKVDGSGGPTYSARLFKVGTTYLFYLPAKEKETFRADSYLQRVLTEKEAEEDLKYLSHTAAQRSK